MIHLSAPVQNPVTGSTPDEGFPGTGDIDDTTDGTDPKDLMAGAPNLTVIPAGQSGGIAVDGLKEIRARTRSAAGDWSALTAFQAQPN